MRVVEGAEGIAEAVRVARPGVISAYPITPQTHIVESLAKLVTDGKLDAQFLTAESEHSAASMVLGASAGGVRTFTATSSQGLLYMSEVVFAIAGMRLPVVMTVANRAISAPLSIWNDHQDSMALRDAGWIQLFAQTSQEAHDLHVVAYRVAEDRRVQLPVMVCVDGFVLTHAYEPIEAVTSEQAEAFLPPFDPEARLDPANPVTFGSFAEPQFYTEARWDVDDALRASSNVLVEALADFGRATGRLYESWGDRYRLEDADVVLVAMGTACQTARLAVERLRASGTAAGLLALRTFRPFPIAEVRRALRTASKVVVLDRSISLGSGGIVAAEIRNALYSMDPRPEVVGVIAGLGGRDVSVETLERALDAMQDGWIDLRPSMGGVA